MLRGAAHENAEERPDQRQRQQHLVGQGVAVGRTRMFNIASSQFSLSTTNRFTSLEMELQSASTDEDSSDPASGDLAEPAEQSNEEVRVKVASGRPSEPVAEAKVAKKKKKRSAQQRAQPCRPEARAERRSSPPTIAEGNLVGPMSPRPCDDKLAATRSTPAAVPAASAVADVRLSEEVGSGSSSSRSGCAELAPARSAAQNVEQKAAAKMLSRPQGCSRVVPSAADLCREDRWSILQRLHDSKQQGTSLLVAGSAQVKAEARVSARLDDDKADVRADAARWTPLAAELRAAELRFRAAELRAAAGAEPRAQAEPRAPPAELEPSVASQPTGRTLGGSRADSLALFTAKLNEAAIVGYLRNAGGRRVILATPIDPWETICQDVLSVQMGAVLLCEATDTAGWCFGTVLAPKSQAGSRGCFRRDGMRPVAAELQRHPAGERVELTPTKWEEVDRARGSSTQDRLRQKALLNRMRSAREAWDMQATAATAVASSGEGRARRR